MPVQCRHPAFCILISVSQLLLVEAIAGAVGCGNGCSYVRVLWFAVDAAHARANVASQDGGTSLGQLPMIGGGPGSVVMNPARVEEGSGLGAS